MWYFTQYVYYFSFYLKKNVLNDIDSFQQILNIEYDKAKCTFTPAKTLNCKKVFSLNKSFKDIYHNDFFYHYSSIQKLCMNIYRLKSIWIWHKCWRTSVQQYIQSTRKSIKRGLRYGPYYNPYLAKFNFRVKKKPNNSGMWSDSGNENKIWRTKPFIINNHR